MCVCLHEGRHSREVKFSFWKHTAESLLLCEKKARFIPQLALSLHTVVFLMGVYFFNTCLTCLFCIHNVFLFHNTLISNVVANHCVVYIVVAEFLLSWRSHLPLDGETGVNQLSLRIPYILPPCEHLAAYLQIECLLKKQTQYANLSLHSTLFVHLVSLREWNVFISLSSPTQLSLTEGHVPPLYHDKVDHISPTKLHLSILHS